MLDQAFAQKGQFKRLSLFLFPLISVLLWMHRAESEVVRLRAGTKREGELVWRMSRRNQCCVSVRSKLLTPDESLFLLLFSFGPWCLCGRKRVFVQASRRVVENIDIATKSPKHEEDLQILFSFKNLCDFVPWWHHFSTGPLELCAYAD
ncbi:hypothetical protein D4R75_13050 [bacterium]|nr:MAG: hypothetical protein D4R75_13050 [bacterium]